MHLFGILYNFYVMLCYMIYIIHVCNYFNNLTWRFINNIHIYTYIHTYTHTSYIYICSVSQLCPTLCDPTDCSLPGSSVHGIFHARTLEWVNIFSSREMDIYIHNIHQSLISMFMKNYEVLSSMNSGTILLTSEFCQQWYAWHKIIVW